MFLHRCVKKAHTHELCIYTGTSLYIHGLIGILSNVSMPVSSFTYLYRPTLTKCCLRPNNEDAPARNFACRPGEVGACYSYESREDSNSSSNRYCSRECIYVYILVDLVGVAMCIQSLPGLYLSVTNRHDILLANV